MIIGVGTDLIEIGRVRKACEIQAFLSRVYTEEECRKFGGNAARLAGNFAVKEAVAKALGTGFRSFWPGDIEVLRDHMGKPFVRLMGGALKRAGELGIGQIHVSITNTKEYAAAFAVAESVDMAGKVCEGVEGSAGLPVESFMGGWNRGQDEEEGI